MTQNDIHEVLSDRDHAYFNALGNIWFYLILRQNEWTYRRVQSVNLIQERRFQVHVSIDFQIPPVLLATILPRKKDTLNLRTFPVPLMIMKKEVLQEFSLLDWTGASIPLLNRKQNGEVAYAVVSSAFLRLTGLDQMPEDVAELLELVVADDVSHRVEALDACRPYFEQEKRNVADFEDFEGVVSSLDENFLLMGNFETHDLKSRRIAKITYERRPDDNLTLAQRMGLARSNAEFEESDVSNCESLHFEFKAPRGLDIVKVEVTKDEKDVKPVPVKKCESSIASVVFNDSGSSPPMREVALAFKVCPSREGLLNSVSIVTFFSAAIITIGLMFVTELKRSPNGDLGLLLLLVPGLMGALLARPGEHIFVSKRLRWVRGASLISSLCLYLAAGVFVLPWTPSGVRHTLWLLLFVSWSMFVFVALVWARLWRLKELRVFKCP